MIDTFADLASSAGNTRGLIEAHPTIGEDDTPIEVFRGEYPRPH